MSVYYLTSSKQNFRYAHDQGRAIGIYYNCQQFFLSYGDYQTYWGPKGKDRYN